MKDEAESLKRAIDERTSEDFEVRCTALHEIIQLAVFGEDHAVRTGAIHYLHEHVGVAVITDPPQPPVLATADGVHIERRHAL